MRADKVIYIAELDQDVDDVIAAEYLHGLGVLKYIVLDPYPVYPIGIQRLQMLESLGIEIKEEIQDNEANIFCGGQLTKIAKHIKSGGTIKNLVLQGGFVGSNIVPLDKQLKKFKGKEEVRTFNFNCDVESTDYILKTTSEQIKNIYCIGKNVCHNPINSDSTLWKAKRYKELFKKYNVREGKLQHDMLACHEGLVLTKLSKDVTVPFCLYLKFKPFNTGLNGNRTFWGSKAEKENTGYRVVTSAITFIR